MPPPHKKVKLDDLEPPPPNQLALVNARTNSTTARPRARAVVRTKRRSPDPPKKQIKMLEELPMDVLFEIFSHLHPRDLLILARTSKWLCTILLQHNNAFIWRASRAWVGLPDPTKSLGMSEPTFAVVLFGNYCHGCGKVATYKILWPLPVRYCEDCTKTNFEEATQRIRAIASATNFRARDIILFTRTKYSKKEVQLSYLPQLAQIEARLSTLQNAGEKHRYVQAQIDYVAAWKEHTPTLVAWLEDYQVKMRTEAEVLQRKRCAAAIARLRAANLDYQVDMLSWEELEELASLKPLAQKSELTDRGWGRICGGIIKFMKERTDVFEFGEEPGLRLPWRMRLAERALRLYRRSKGAKGAAYEAASGLRFGDLVAMPKARALLEDQSPDLTRETFLARLADMIPSLIIDWHAECKSYLVSLAAAHLTKADVPFTEGALTVDLAIMSFRCKECSFEPLRWPEVLEHTCLRDLNSDECPPPTNQTYETEAWTYLEMLGWDQGKWDPEPQRNWSRRRRPILSLGESIRSVVELVAACGLDPTTATGEEMSASGARFVCRVCSGGELVREVYDWTGAIEHDNMQHSHRQDHHDHWERLPDDQAERARALSLMVQETRYVCTWCYGSSSITNIRQHVQLYHEQEDPRYNADYYCQETMLPSVMMISEDLMQDLGAQTQVDEGSAFFARF